MATIDPTRLSATGRASDDKEFEMGWNMDSAASWIPKLRPELEPKIVESKRTGEPMLVPSPMQLARQIRKVRKGRLTTPKRLREKLAAEAGAESTCPMTTGILLSIVAGAAEEQLAGGSRPVAPYWRVVEEDGSLRSRNPAGAEVQARRLRAEGHRVQRDGERKRWRVESFGG